MDDEDVVLPSDPEDFSDSPDIYDFSENTNFDSDSENSVVQNNETGGEHLNNTDFTNEFGLEEILIQNFSNDQENEEDCQWLGMDYWYRSRPDVGPFMGSWQLLMDPQQKQPEHFFNQLFEDDMWSCIADETN